MDSTLLTCQPTTRSHKHRFTKIKFRTSSHVLVLIVGLLPTLQKFRSALAQYASRSSLRGLISKDRHIMWFASISTIVGRRSLSKLCWKTPKTSRKFGKTFFVFVLRRSPEKKIFFEDLFFFFWGGGGAIPWKNFETFFWRTLAPVSLGLALASSNSVLGLESIFSRKGCPWPPIFFCPWPWARALCPRLHLCERRMLNNENWFWDVHTGGGGSWGGGVPKLSQNICLLNIYDIKKTSTLT